MLEMKLTIVSYQQRIVSFVAVVLLLVMVLIHLTLLYDDVDVVFVSFLILRIYVLHLHDVLLLNMHNVELEI
jgi:hypothetical protein